ncbi:uncharacterized protein BDR25DRAFT_360985 [Lindgomyces ingoldianus]|uniref:Uncharacterized protein n=1 Tax=Lindgomyces ingoldianus TaxID=673940 RepID=A0ACB6QDU7_9PLEO|nr:uncharacterized protein BDR25DRAFT_360985 [Lindgomyces ingoldianus]KAF2465084.1 hypothetical protein BDR25DRAFT_360985 [Lindgomyces ingoldianus]
MTTAMGFLDEDKVLRELRWFVVRYLALETESFSQLFQRPYHNLSMMLTTASKPLSLPLKSHTRQTTNTSPSIFTALTSGLPLIPPKACCRINGLYRANSQNISWITRHKYMHFIDFLLNSGKETEKYIQAQLSSVLDDNILWRILNPLPWRADNGTGSSSCAKTVLLCGTKTMRQCKFSRADLEFSTEHAVKEVAWFPSLALLAPLFAVNDDYWNAVSSRFEAINLFSTFPVSWQIVIRYRGHSLLMMENSCCAEGDLCATNGLCRNRGDTTNNYRSKTPYVLITVGNLFLDVTTLRDKEIQNHLAYQCPQKGTCIDELVFKTDDPVFYTTAVASLIQSTIIATHLTASTLTILSTTMASTAAENGTTTQSTTTVSIPFSNPGTGIAAPRNPSSQALAIGVSVRAVVTLLLTSVVGFISWRLGRRRQQESKSAAETEGSSTSAALHKIMTLELE